MKKQWLIGLCLLLLIAVFAACQIGFSFPRITGPWGVIVNWDLLFNSGDRGSETIEQKMILTQDAKGRLTGYLGEYPLEGILQRDGSFSFVSGDLLFQGTYENENLLIGSVEDIGVKGNWQATRLNEE